MDYNTIIKNKAEFETTAQNFLDKIFNTVLKNNLGDIEIRTFPNGQWPEQYFCQTVKEAAEIAFDLCNSGIDVYFGVNPRTGCLVLIPHPNSSILYPRKNSRHSY